MAAEIFETLLKNYKNPQLELHYNNAFELLIATILAAQTRDERVNKVTPIIFKTFSKPQDFLAVNAQNELEKIISSINFYRKKAVTIINTCKLLVEKYNGKVPEDVDELSSLPGIGRKTAAMVIANAYGIPAVFVDTHVLRTTQRIGLTTSDKPEVVETELKKLFPEKYWKDLCLLLIMHGKAICHAKNPTCYECPVNKWCNYFKTTTQK